MLLCRWCVGMGDRPCDGRRSRVQSRRLLCMIDHIHETVKRLVLDTIFSYG